MLVGQLVRSKIASGNFESVNTNTSESDLDPTQFLLTVALPCQAAMQHPAPNLAKKSAYWAVCMDLEIPSCDLNGRKALTADIMECRIRLLCIVPRNI